MNPALIREEIREALLAWGAGAQPYMPGSFLTAVLENDLAGAVGQADWQNIEVLPAIVAFVYRNLPSPCWGSKDKVEAWLVKAQERAYGRSS
jgi:hypothetical protein